MSLAVLYSVPWALPRHSIDTLNDGFFNAQSQPSTTVAWGVQYGAVYVPVRVPCRCTVVELGYVPGTTATGNIDLGLYDSGGTRLVSTGSQAKANTLNVEEFNVTDTTIGPGTYYLALSNDTTTDTFLAWNQAAPILAAYGVLAETLGSVTLPATATWTIPQTLAVAPILTALLVTEVD